MMPHARGHVFFEKSQSLATPYKLGDDPRSLQLAFACLCDEAAQTIYRAGSDLDEVLVERILIVRNEGKEHEVPAEFIADAELLRESVVKILAENHHDGAPKRPEISAVKIIARHDEMNRT